MIKSKLRLERRRRRDLYKCNQIAGHKVTLFKSSRHIYASVSDSTRVLTQISTLSIGEAKVNKKTCTIIGNKVAEFLKSIKVGKVFFNKSGYKFHGRVKAVADAIREGGVLC